MEKTGVYAIQVFQKHLISVAAAEMTLVLVTMFSPLVPLIYYAVNFTLSAFVIASALYFLMLWLTFSLLGYNISERDRVGKGAFIKRYVPSLIFYIAFNTLRLVLSFIPPSTNSVLMTAYIFAGRAFGAIPAAATVKNFGVCWVISLILHVILTLVLSYVFYLSGVKKREKFKEAILSGKEPEKKRAVPLAKTLRFIPFANLV